MSRKGSGLLDASRVATAYRVQILGFVSYPGLHIAMQSAGVPAREGCATAKQFRSCSCIRSVAKTPFFVSESCAKHAMSKYGPATVTVCKFCIEDRCMIPAFGDGQIEGAVRVFADTSDQGCIWENIFCI